MLGPNALETTSMDDFFQFIVINSWKLNINLPFLFGDRQAVKSGSIVFPFRELKKSGVFFSKRGRGVRYF